MLTSKVITGATVDINKYYDNVDDYYAKENGAGLWMGKAAVFLNLDGSVKKEQFVEMLNGKSADTILRRKTFSKDVKIAKERRAIDFTFSAPKSVSIQALMGHDENMIKAHEHAVKVAFGFLEAHAAVRRKVKGETHKIDTGNLVAAVFRHELSREMEPQLHSHCVTLNTSKDDDRWASLSNEQMLKNIKPAGLIYKKAMADFLLEKGYDLRQTKDGFELAHITDKAIRALSTRSVQIEAKLNEKGKTRDDAYTWEKQKETLDTRKTKTAAEQSTLMNDWKTKTRGILDLDTLKPPQNTATRQKVDERKQALQNEREALKSVHFAIEHLQERQGLFTRQDIQTEALMSGLLKGFSYAEVDKAITTAEKKGLLLAEIQTYAYLKGVDRQIDDKFFKKDVAESAKTHTMWVAYFMREGMTPLKAAQKVIKDLNNNVLLAADVRYASSKALDLEKQIMHIERNNRNNVPQIMTDLEVKNLVSGAGLKDGQYASAALALTAQHRFVGVQGLAGSGKSHTFSAIYKAMQESNSEYQLFGIAPKGTQVKELKELGMEARTIALLLKSKSLQDSLNKKTVILMDEAGTVSTKDMHSVMKLAEEKGARIIMVGDIKQTHAVEAGKPFELLKIEGMEFSHMDEIIRQKTDVNKLAVEFAAAGYTSRAIHELEHSSSHTPQTRIDTQILERTSEDRRIKSIVKDYVGYDDSKRNKTLIISGTNDSRRKINESIRTSLKIENQKNVTTLEVIDFSEAQRKQIRAYEEGSVLVFQENASNGIKKDERYTVETVHHASDKVYLRNVDSQEAVYFEVTREGHKANIYRPVKTDLGVNDWIRITRNDNQNGLFNGERFKITEIKDGELTLSDAKENALEKKIGISKINHFEHAYSTTVYSAQGLTSDYVIFNADSKSLTSNKMVFYVGISRPRYGVKIYTNDKVRMTESMSREAKKYNAIEIKTNDLHDSNYAKAQNLTQSKTMKR